MSCVPAKERKQKTKIKKRQTTERTIYQENWENPICIYRAIYPFGNRVIVFGLKAETEVSSLLKFPSDSSHSVFCHWAHRFPYQFPYCPLKDIMGWSPFEAVESSQQVAFVQFAISIWFQFELQRAHHAILQPSLCPVDPKFSGWQWATFFYCQGTYQTTSNCLLYIGLYATPHSGHNRRTWFLTRSNEELKILQNFLILLMHCAKMIIREAYTTKRRGRRIYKRNAHT